MRLRRRPHRRQARLHRAQRNRQPFSGRSRHARRCIRCSVNSARHHSPILNNVAATRQAYINYLSNARNAAQQAIDRLSAVGAPPVDNGQQIVDQTRTQLTQLRKDLDDALAQLNRANPQDPGAIGLAVGAADNMIGALGNRTQVLATLYTDSQLRAAINQAPECQNLSITNATSDTNQPTAPS